VTDALSAGRSPFFYARYYLTGALRGACLIWSVSGAAHERANRNQGHAQDEAGRRTTTPNSWNSNRNNRKPEMSQLTENKQPGSILIASADPMRIGILSPPTVGERRISLPFLNSSFLIATLSRLEFLLTHSKHTTIDFLIATQSLIPKSGNGPISFKKERTDAAESASRRGTFPPFPIFPAPFSLLSAKHTPGALIAASKDCAILRKITAVRPLNIRAASRSERPCAES
jgi:hypothetical protein